MSSRARSYNPVIFCALETTRWRAPHQLRYSWDATRRCSLLRCSLWRSGRRSPAAAGADQLSSVISEKNNCWSFLDQCSGACGPCEVLWHCEAGHFLHSASIDEDWDRRCVKHFIIVSVTATRTMDQIADVCFLRYRHYDGCLLALRDRWQKWRKVEDTCKYLR